MSNSSDRRFRQRNEVRVTMPSLQYRATVSVEGAEVPLDVTAWSSKAAAERAAERYREVATRRGWTHTVRVETREER